MQMGTSGGRFSDGAVSIGQMAQQCAQAMYTTDSVR
jgi:hypothetical protein